jgi:hypothetical protein
MPDPVEYAPVSRVVRPAIIVGGHGQQELENALLRAVISANAQGLSQCDLTLNNWGPTPGGAGYLYFDRRIVDFGKRLEVKLGVATLFDGPITALEAEFSELSPPALIVRAHTTIPQAGRGGQLSGPALVLAYGARLRAFSVVADGSRSAINVLGRGVAEIDSALQPGVLVSLTNLGTVFSGVYRVAEVKHIFDNDGYRSEFAARRSWSA